MAKTHSFAVTGPYSRSACAENLIPKVSARCSIPAGVVVQLLRYKPAVFRRRHGPNGNQVFFVTLRRRRHDLKKAYLPVPPQKADPACSSFARLCVSGGQFVSSG